MDLVEGLRVRVAPHVFWPEGAVGTVRPYPGFVADLCGDAEGCSRVFRGARGPITMAWVVFDEPSRDGEGDGPYDEGEVLAEHLSQLA